MGYYKFQNGANGYTGCKDDRIDSGTGDHTFNNGGHTVDYAGRQTAARFMRDLQRWDLSLIPSTAICSAANMYLFDTNWASRTANNIVNLYKISDANGNWTEGSSIDTNEIGAPSWDFKANNSTAWAGSAGLSTVTTDYINTSLGTATFTDGVSAFVRIGFNASGCAFLSSIFGTTGGNGFIIFGDEATDGSWTEWASSSNATVANRPILEIYTNSQTINKIRPRIFAPGLAR